MSKWITEFELEDGDTMPEHMDLEYKGARIDFHCRPLEQEPCEDAVSRQAVIDMTGLSEWFDSSDSYNEFVIALSDLPSVTPQPRWIPLTKRPMTDEEIEHYFEYTDMRIDDTYTILDCPLPDDGQEVLISWGGNVGNDVFIQDNEGCYFEGVDIDDVDAWMPLPKPYEPQESEDKNA